MKQLPEAFNTIVFLNLPEDDINREARITEYKPPASEYIWWDIVNLNMPYQGTMNMMMPHKWLLDEYEAGRIDLLNL